MKRFAVGTHGGKVYFDCLECAFDYYNNLNEKKKYLIDEYENKLIVNTYGWKNEN